MFFKRVTEAGKAISSSNMEKIQNIHDASSTLGAGCSFGMGGGGIYEADRDLTKILEAALPMEQSHMALRGHLRSALMTAHKVDPNSYTYQDQPYINDVFPGHVVYGHKGDTLKRSYKVEYGSGGTDPKVTLGEAKKVHTAYVESKGDVAEAYRAILIDMPADCELDKAWFATKEAPAKDKPVIITLADGEYRVTESALFHPTEAVTVATIKEGATRIPVKLIAPGWGSSAYYPKEVLKRDGPSIFKKGTHMMWNHATESEEADRPEGNLDNLAAILTQDAVYQENGIKGPGLYSEAKVFSDYAERVAEKGAHIGVSINAAIRGKEGEMEGRTGRIAEKFVHAFSTDFVTKAGAGGAPIVPVLESQRVQSGGSTKMTPEETQAHDITVRENVDLKKKLIEMEEGQNHILAVATIGAALKEAEVPFSQPLLELACKGAVVKEGKIDPEWAKKTVALFTTEAGGKVQDLGRGKEAATDTAPETKKVLESALKTLGMSEAGLKYAVEGRA